MDTLEITLQRKTDDGWPVVVTRQQADGLPLRSEENLVLRDDIKQVLLRHIHDPQEYGTVLGQALWNGTVRDALKAVGGRQVRLLLEIEDKELRTLYWAWLCAPIGRGGKWQQLALSQRVLYSHYLPSITDRRFPPIGRRDLKALVVVADPPQPNRYGLAHFDATATVQSICSALGDIPCDVLANVDHERVIGPPTADTLLQQLTAQPYTLLHIVAHGSFREEDGETILFLLNEEANVQPLTTSDLIERLDLLDSARGLPQLAFLSTCESAAPEAEHALGGLGPQLVRELGMPAVVAMTRKVSILTAEQLASAFYTRLRDHGEVDRALVEATASLMKRGDIAVPALFGRLGTRPFFSDNLLDNRPLTNTEIEDGLTRMAALLEERAPVLCKQFRKQASTLRSVLTAEAVALSDAARCEREQALSKINILSDEVLDLSFRGLALGQEPPLYYADECPFPGLYAFQVEDARFFFGREKLIKSLLARLQNMRFVTVSGPSGSGKSSLVLAGIIPILLEPQLAHPDLDLEQRKILLQELQPLIDKHLYYMTPTDSPRTHLQSLLDRQSTTGSLDGILVVDQFEELFTHCTDHGQRKTFITQLLSVACFRHVIITVRADFLGECALYPDLKEKIQGNLELVGPMTTTELRSAMEQQANQVRLRFEADLRPTIFGEVKDEPGAMPLLQHMLRQLWERRHGRWLLKKEYDELGGIQTAIAHTADELYQTVSVTEQKWLRDIFVRLTHIGDEKGNYGDTRQREQLKNLMPADEDVDVDQFHKLVTRLADERLVVIDEELNAEVAHESLIKNWPKLQNWLEEKRIIYRLRATISDAAKEWMKNGKREEWLVHWGQRLSEVTNLENAVQLNDIEKAYIEHCKRFEREMNEAQRKSDLSEMGWGVIFPRDEAQEFVSNAKKALAELLTLRRQQAGGYFHVFEGEDAYQSGETAREFLNRHGVGTNFRPDKVPYYLLIVGNPEMIPFEFQYDLQTRYAVGRLDFDTFAEFTSYARSVVTIEIGRVVRSKTVTYFGTSHQDDVTQKVTENLTLPLSRELAEQMPDWKVNTVVGNDAKKSKLASIIGGDEMPALLYLACYGMEFPSASARQPLYQGALLCQDWSIGEPITEDFYFSAVDVNHDANLLGTIAFSFGLYFCGTPQNSDFHRSKPLAPKPFVSALPKLLLGHPKGGMLAVIGHVDMNWYSSIEEGRDIVNQESFEKTLHYIMKGYPVGLAIDFINQRYLQFAAEFAALKAKFDLGSNEKRALSPLRFQMLDARNYIVLGDPAAHLSIGDSVTLDSHPTIEPVAANFEFPSRPTRPKLTINRETDDHF